MSSRRARAMLGALTPDTETQLNAAITLASDTEAAARTDLLIFLETGGSDEAIQRYSSALDQLSQRRLALHAEMQTLEDDSDAAPWSASMSRLQAELEAVWAQLSSERKSSIEGFEFRGLWWGLGVATVGVGLFWLVWRGKKRRTVRRSR